MAIALDQYCVATTATDSLGYGQESSTTLNFPTAPASGATMFAFTSTYSGVNNAFPTITSDSGGNTYTQLIQYQLAGTFHYTISVWYSHNIVTAGSFSISFGDSSVQNFGCSAVSFTGIAGIDGSVVSNNGTAASSFQSGTYTPSYNGNLIISAADGSSVVNQSPYFGIPSGFTTILNDGHGSGGAQGAWSFLIQTTATAVNPTWTQPSSTDWYAGTFGFYATGATPAGGASWPPGEIVVAKQAVTRSSTW